MDECIRDVLPEDILPKVHEQVHWDILTAAFLYFSDVTPNVLEKGIVCPRYLLVAILRKTVAYQDPPSRGSSRQKSWSGLPFLSPGDLSNSGIEPRSSAL